MPMRMQGMVHTLSFAKGVGGWSERLRIWRCEICSTWCDGRLARISTNIWFEILVSCSTPLSIMPSQSNWNVQVQHQWMDCWLHAICILWNWWLQGWFAKLCEGLWFSKMSWSTLLIYLSFSFESLYPEGCHHWIQNVPIWDLPEVGLQEKTPGTCPQWWRPCTRAEERPPPDADPGLVGCGTVWIHGTSLRDFLVDRAREWSIGAWLPPTGIGWGWPRNMEPWYSTFLAFGPPAVVGQPCIELLLGFRPMGTFFCWFGCCRKTEIESVCNQIWTLSILPGPEKRPAVGREVLWSFLDRFYFFPSIHDKKLCLDKWTKQRCNLLMCESYHLRFGIWLWLCLGQLTAPVSMRRLQKVMASHSSSGICWKCTCQVSSRNYQLTRLGEVNIF